MGLMTWPGSRPRKPDVAVAKNYLNENELSDLNLIVSLYLDFAELQARSRRVMTMRDWIAKLDDFMRISEREISDPCGQCEPRGGAGKSGGFRVAEPGQSEEFDKVGAVLALRVEPRPTDAFDDGLKLLPRRGVADRSVALHLPERRSGGVGDDAVSDGEAEGGADVLHVVVISGFSHARLLQAEPDANLGFAHVAHVGFCAPPATPL